jgi:dienelactone hydrolase
MRFVKNPFKTYRVTYGIVSHDTTHFLVATMLFLALTLTTLGGNAVGGDLRKVVYTTKPETLKGYLCRPSGAGQFPAVAYNHGGVGDIIGGAPKETCEALAAAGFVGFAPIRRQTRSMAGHPDDVQAGLDYLLGLDYVDRDRVAMMGFSRGGALTFMAAARAAPIKAAVIMASANPPLESGFTFGDAVNIRVPVLLLVAENDTGSRKTMGQNTLEGMRRMSAALAEAGNTPKLIVYPPYRGDGHEMFFEIGAYWTDVVEFLKKHL